MKRKTSIKHKQILKAVSKKKQKEINREFEYKVNHYLKKLNKQFFRILKSDTKVYDNVSRRHDKRKQGIPHLRDSWVMHTRKRNGFYMTPKGLERHEIKLRVDNTSIPYRVYTSGVGDITIKPRTEETGQRYLRFYSPEYKRFIRKKEVQLRYTDMNRAIKSLVQGSAKQAIRNVGTYKMVLKTPESIEEILYTIDLMSELS